MDKRRRILTIGLIVLWLLLGSTGAYGDLKSLGVLKSVSGDVLLKHKGFWTAQPEADMTLYHGDKLLTRQGSCRIRFADGSLLKVAPHSSVRLAEIYIKQGSRLIRHRDIRVFLGKIRYSSTAPDALQTHLVAPTAVAALRGTDVEFGTDGVLATLNQLEGKSDLAGNVSESAAVPDTTADEANANAEYKASQAAGKVRQEYLKAVKSLLKSSRPADRSMLLATVDPALVYLLISQTGDEAAVSEAHRVLILAALYVVADMNALVEENTALIDHPDERTAKRAEEALARARTERTAAVENLDQAKRTVQEVNRIIEETLAENPEAASVVGLARLKPVIGQMLAEQKQANRVALGKELIVNIHTAGLDEALSSTAAQQIRRQAATRARERAGDFQADLPDYADPGPRFPDRFKLGPPDPDPITDRDGDGVPDNRDLDPLDPTVTVDKGGYAN